MFNSKTNKMGDLQKCYNNFETPCIFRLTTTNIARDDLSSASASDSFGSQSDKVLHKTKYKQRKQVYGTNVSLSQSGLEITI